MNRMALALAATIVTGGAVLAQPGATQPAAGDRSDLRATTLVALNDAQGASIGTVEFRQLAGHLLAIVQLRNLSPGAHAIQLYQTGKCEGPDFASAGRHFSGLHPRLGGDADGAAVGSFPNLQVASDGTARFEFVAAHLAAAPASVGAGADGPFLLADADGSALIVHQHGYDPSDLHSAGGRIACGVVALR